MTTRIYKLIDPRDGRPRYIGMTEGKLVQRVCKHVAGCYSHLKKNPNSKIHNWLAELIELELMPIIRLIKVVPKEKGSEYERKYIEKYRAGYPDLLNVSNGGKGISLEGIRHPAAALTFDMVKEIRQLYQDKKYTQEQLATLYGVTRAHISKIILNKRRQNA